MDTVKKSWILWNKCNFITTLAKYILSLAINLESIRYNFVKKVSYHNSFHILRLKFPTLVAVLADDFCQSKQSNNSGKFQTQIIIAVIESIILPYLSNKVIMNGL